MDTVKWLMEFIFQDAIHFFGTLMILSALGSLFGGFCRIVINSKRGCE